MIPKQWQTNNDNFQYNNVGITTCDISIKIICYTKGCIPKFIVNAEDL